MTPITKKLPTAKAELAAARSTADALRDLIAFAQQVALAKRYARAIPRGHIFWQGHERFEVLSTGNRVGKWGYTAAL